MIQLTERPLVPELKNPPKVLSLERNSRVMLFHEEPEIETNSSEQLSFWRHRYPCWLSLACGWLKRFAKATTVV